VKKKLINKRLTIGLSQPEIEQLEAYCQKTGRSYTDVIRECVRNLPINSLKILAERKMGDRPRSTS
jgi:hypothetical protein